jgi:hypothetical protein
MDFSAQRPEAIREISPIGCKTQALRSNFMNQPPASQKCTVFRGALNFTRQKGQPKKTATFLLLRQILKI